MKIFIVTFLIIISCQPKDTIVPDHQVVAKVNSDILSENQLRSYLVNPEEKNNDLTRNIIRKWIDKSVLYQEAINLGYHLDALDRFNLEEIKKDLIVNKYLDSKFSGFVLTDKELNDYYILNNEEFKRTDDESHIVHLFLSERNPSIQAEIFKQKDLLLIVNQYRLNKTINQNLLNGDLGYVKDVDLPKSFNSRILKAKLNEIIGPIRMNSGYHYFQVLDRKKEGTFIPYEQVKDVIRQRLYLKKVQEIRGQLIDAGKSKYIIENNYR